MKERKKCSLPGKFPDVKRAGVSDSHLWTCFFRFLIIIRMQKNSILQIYIYNERNVLHYSLELFISDSCVDDNIARNW